MFFEWGVPFCSAAEMQVEQSADKNTEIDISKVFNKLFANNIVHISFGEDIGETLLPIYMRTDPDGNKPMVLKNVTLSESIDEIFEQVLAGIRFKVINPLYWAIFIATGDSVPFTQYERHVDHNCGVLRRTVLEYIQKRKAGKVKSSVGKGADLLTLFLQNPDVFTDEFIVDELMDFFVAATQTTQHLS